MTPLFPSEHFLIFFFTYGHQGVAQNKFHSRDRTHLTKCRHVSPRYVLCRCLFDLITSTVCHQWGEIQPLLGSSCSQPEVCVSNSSDKSGSETANFSPLIVKFTQSGYCRCKNKIHRCLILGEKYLIEGV